jgi:hypothetical protein
MMIFLSVGVTLAIYGLVRFGYGPAAAGYKLPPCAGPAPTFTQSATYSGRTVGVATKFPYQFRVHSFAKVLTRTPGIAEYYEPFPNPAGFQSNVACFFAKRGILSLVQLDPVDSVSLSAIVHGKYDRYLRDYAEAVKKFRAPIALSFGHEMNGWWYPWSVHLNSSPALAKSKPATFVAAWQHIHDIFAKAGATNAKWVWTVRQNVRLAKHPDFPGIKSWWPGGKYVDWVGMDGYFRRPNEDFNSVFGTQVTDIRAITKKPILIAETAVRMDHPGATKQISELFAGVRKTPGLLGLVWFDLDAVKTGIRWNIDQNASAIQAVREAIGVTGHKSG